MKNKKLKEYYDDINGTLLSFEQEYQQSLNYKDDFDDVIFTQKTHDDIIVYLTALRNIIALKMKQKGDK